MSDSWKFKHDVMMYVGVVILYLWQFLCALMRFFCNRMYIYVCSKFFFGIARVAQLMQFFSISYVILDPVNFR